MAITQRVQFNTSASHAGAYEVFLNPTSLQLNSSNNFKGLPILDGGKTLQDRFFDDRPIILKWDKIFSNYSGINNFLGMAASLQSYRGNIRYVHFGDIDYAVPTLGWKKTRVGDVRMEIDPGGKLVYTLTVELYPQQ